MTEDCPDDSIKQLSAYAVLLGLQIDSYTTYADGGIRELVLLPMHPEDSPVPSRSLGERVFRFARKTSWGRITISDGRGILEYQLQHSDKDTDS